MITAIIQARLGSTRLPGKVLMEIKGVSLLEIQIERLKKVKHIDQIVVATTNNKNDDALEEFCNDKNYKCFRGNENDVLDRFYKTVKTYGGEHVVRITADCPLLSPHLCSSLISFYIENNYDFVHSGPNFAEGLDNEIFTFQALERSWKEATRKTDREHLTMYMHNNPHMFKKYTFNTKEDDSKFRVTVDEKKDFEVVEKIVTHFWEDKYSIEWSEIKTWLLQNKNIMAINMNIIRNEGYFRDLAKEETELEKQKKERTSMNSGIQLWNKAKKIIPGGNSLLSKRIELFLPEKWPSYYKKAKGISVWDLDDIIYTDMSLMGVGTNILGYANDEVDDAVISAIKNGTTSTLNCPEEVALAEKLIEIHPWAEMVRYSRTGGEACAMAIRIARAASGKDVVAFCGYHGWHDWYLAANLADDKSLDGMLLPGLEPKGVPRSLMSMAIPFNYNKIEELENIVNRNDIGVIIMEPLRSQEPQDQFLQKVRSIADNRNIVLIFDEVSSGFRKNLGGIHLTYGVEPDIAVLGKAMGNGYAISTVIGKRAIMEAAQSTFISSTYWTERTGPVAALKAMEIMKRDNVFSQMLESDKYISNCWKEIANKYGIEISIHGLPSLPHFVFTSLDNLKYKTFLTQEMLKRGYIAATGIYLCALHTKEVIDKYITALDEVFSLIKNAHENSSIDTLLETPLCHSGFKRLA